MTGLELDNPVHVEGFSRDSRDACRFNISTLVKRLKDSFVRVVPGSQTAIAHRS